MTYATLDDYINREFPSKYLRGEDLKGQEVVTTIAHVEVENLFSPQTGGYNNRITLFFAGKEKGIVLAKTRTKELKAIFGNVAPKELEGKQITLYGKPKGHNIELHIKAAKQTSPIAAGLQMEKPY